VERLAVGLDRTIVATDISPRVLLRTGRALEEVGLGGRVSLVACDARRTPFRDGAVPTLTTYVGLGNVAEPRALLAELRRIVSGCFLAVTTFYPPDDGENAAAIRDLGLERLLYRDALLSELEAAGWVPDVVSACRAPAKPTPAGVVVEGVGVDALPVADAELEWALVEAR
jgi:ubiquinone/menaquinone biosynthesis C-methylase UbiE